MRTGSGAAGRLPVGLSGDAITPAGRLLAAADAYHAMTEQRPHRAALTTAEAATQLRAGVRQGLFDGDAADAVLRAAGHQVTRRRERPAGLTSREVEVLALLVRGLSNKQIAEQLVISRRTASSHVEHIYAKIGVSNRARASLFAEARPDKHGRTPPRPTLALSGDATLHRGAKLLERCKPPACERRGTRPARRPGLDEEHQRRATTR